MNFSMIRYVIGLVMLFESAFLSLPCLIALIYHEKKGFSFWIMLFVCLIIGILFVMKKPKKTVYYAKEGFLTVAISWIVMSFFGALPFVINGDIPSVVDAMFETVSGFTTTGSSILTDVEAAHHGGHGRPLRFPDACRQCQCGPAARQRMVQYQGHLEVLAPRHPGRLRGHGHRLDFLIWMVLR